MDLLLLLIVVVNSSLRLIQKRDVIQEQQTRIQNDGKIGGA